MAWGITASGNLNVVDGGESYAHRQRRRDGLRRHQRDDRRGDDHLLRNGPQLTFQPTGTTRLAATKLLDLGAQKVFTFRGGKNRLKLMFDAFNMFNVNTITSYSSNNLSSANFNTPIVDRPAARVPRRRADRVLERRPAVRRQSQHTGPGLHRPGPFLAGGFAPASLDFARDALSSSKGAPPYGVARGDPTIPAPLRGRTRSARALYVSVRGLCPILLGCFRGEAFRAKNTQPIQPATS